MAQTKKGPARPCRIFMCYRGNTAETANHFRSVMEHDRENSYGNIWYSSRQYSGRLIQDLPAIMGEAEWVIFFIGKTFTGGFIDENEETNKRCVTAHELIAIERERQKRQREGREELKMLAINIDDAKLDRTCELDLKHLFSNAKILEDDSVGTYTELLPNVYNSSRDDLFDFVGEHIAPICALPAALSVKTEPIPESEHKTESKPEPVAKEKKTEAVSAMAPKNDALVRQENGNVLFGSYPQTAEGKRRPIEWLVLKREADRALLISRYALDAKPYNHTPTTTTWAECSLQSWLTGRRKEDFPQAAFTAAEREWILQTPVPADRNPFYGTTPGKPTEDKVFLLSIPEAKALFSSDEARRCAPTDYAKNQGANTHIGYKAEGKPSCWWWLRSPGRNSNCAVCVNCSGSVSEYGDYVDYAFVGVRPALWVKL